MTTLKCKLFTASARVPERAHAGDAGLDLFVASDERDPLWVGETRVVWTDVGVELPEGTVGLVLPRSSMSKRGLHVSTGVIDQTYRGNIGVTITNVTREHQPIQRGLKCAQLVIVPCLTPAVSVVEELSATERNTGGFGSSGSGL